MLIYPITCENVSATSTQTVARLGRWVGFPYKVTPIPKETCRQVIIRFFLQYRGLFLTCSHDTPFERCWYRREPPHDQAEYQAHHFFTVSSDTPGLTSGRINSSELMNHTHIHHTGQYKCKYCCHIIWIKGRNYLEHPQRLISCSVSPLITMSWI